MSAPAETLESARAAFGEDVIRDLAREPKQLQSKYLYDRLGLRLFEAICRLPWYTITRAERALLNRHSVAIASELSGPLTLTELGPGDGEKIAILVQALLRQARPLVTHLIDISQTALDQAERRLDRYEGISVVGHRATYEVGLRRAASLRPPGGAFLVLFLGSNLGNFDLPAAREFLRSIREALRPGDALLLGADLLKPERELLLAYDDPLGVTAAFNKNLLLRINRELGGNFDLSAFSHRAVFNRAEGRVEMHLVSLREQGVSIPGSAPVLFRTGETIWTESSYKYSPEALEELIVGAGFVCRHQWIEPEARFALSLFFAR
jgi:dimethylhistidine N-methyltransferase